MAKKILIEVEKIDEEYVSVEIYYNEYIIEVYDFENMKDFKKNILKLVRESTENNKLTKKDLKIKYINT